MDLTELTITRLGSAFRTGETTPLAVTEAYLERIARTDPLLNAYITVTADRALADAHAASAAFAGGRDAGPLQGVPLALKDIIDTAGITTTMGAGFLRDNVPPADAAVAQRLRDAGSVLLGKTNTHEFAMGVSNNNPHFGPVHNPWDLSRISGGSSGGSAAAVVAGLAAGAIGSDTGGSVRIPASLCGCVGFKPSFGTVSRRGVFPFSARLDHVGPLARTVADARLLFEAIAGYDPADPATSRSLLPPSPTSGLRGLRIGVPAAHTAAFEPAVASAFEAALGTLETLGARLVREIQLPAFPMEQGMAAVATEGKVVHQQFLATHAAEYGPDVQSFLGMALESAGVVEAIWAMVANYSAALRQALETVDLLAMPTTLLTALPIGQETISAGDHELPALVAYVLNTVPFNVSGLPALSLPCGVTGEGLPVGLQLVGRPLADYQVLDAGQTFEQATHWHERRQAPASVAAR